MYTIDRLVPTLSSKPGSEATLLTPAKSLCLSFVRAAAFLQDRLIVVVTYFDHYYKTVNKKEFLTAEQLMAIVCSSIKDATGHTFPKESVVPVCTQWALIARQLIQRPQDHQLKHRALKCLKLCFKSGVGNENALSVARSLERASGILALEERY